MSNAGRHAKHTFRMEDFRRCFVHFDYANDIPQTHAAVKAPVVDFRVSAESLQFISSLG